MFAKGSLNGHKGMNFFMDSGLAASMPLVVVDETVEFLGLKKNEIPGTTYYWSPIESHGLDGLASGPSHPEGGAQPSPPARGGSAALGNVFVEEDFFWQFGFMADALISHQYLWPKGSWTIDFDNMKYYFRHAQDGPAFQVHRLRLFCLVHKVRAAILHLCVRIVRVLPLLRRGATRREEPDPERATKGR